MKNENSKKNDVATAPFIMLDDKKSSLSLHRQIYEALRAAILAALNHPSIARIASKNRAMHEIHRAVCEDMQILRF